MPLAKGLRANKTLSQQPQSLPPGGDTGSETVDEALVQVQVAGGTSERHKAGTEAGEEGTGSCC